MRMKQKKLNFIFFFVCGGIITTVNASQNQEPLNFDCLYPETPISRVLRAMKQLHATMTSIQEQEIPNIDSTLAQIVEIQSLTLCGTLQELDRAIEKGFQITRDHAALICHLWKSLQVLVRDEGIKRYLCCSL